MYTSRITCVCVHLLTVYGTLLLVSSVDLAKRFGRPVNTSTLTFVSPKPSGIQAAHNCIYPCVRGQVENNSREANLSKLNNIRTKQCKTGDHRDCATRFNSGDTRFEHIEACIRQIVPACETLPSRHRMQNRPEKKKVPAGWVASIALFRSPSTPSPPLPTPRTSLLFKPPIHVTIDHRMRVALVVGKKQIGMYWKNI